MLLTSERKGFIQIIVKFRAEKNRKYVSIMHQTSFLRGTKYYAPKRLCSNILKWNELKVYISLKENKLACFFTSGSTQIHDLVHDF